MKFLSILACTGVVSACVLGVVMAKSNPDGVSYEEYASKRLTLYLKENGCGDAKNSLEKILEVNCDRLIDEATPTIRGVLGANTERYDFVVFSFYRTNLKFSKWLPGYQFETVGAFNNFFTYSAKQN